MENEQVDTGKQQLPFDPRTLLTSLFRKWWILALGPAIGAVLAVIAASTLGVREYVSETSLLFTAKEGDMVGGVYRVPSLRTQINLVKLPENIKEVREKLGWSTSLQSLGSAIAVAAQNETSMLIIRATSDNAERAATLANTARDVFLENSVILRTEEANRSIGKTEERLAVVSGELLEADKALEDFNNVNKVVDLDKEAQWFLEQFTAIDTLYEQSKIERSTVELQLADLDRIMENLKKQVEQEQSESGEMEGLGAAKTRADRLREKIYADESRRMNQAKLTEMEISLQRAKQGVAEGLMSQAELDKAQAIRDAQQAITVDTGQVRDWKDELDRLDKAIVPVQGKTDTATAPILREMLSKSFELQLQKSSLEDKVRQLQEARDKIRGTLDNLPTKQKEQVNLIRNVKVRASEKQELGQKLAAARELASRDTPDFSIAALAEPPLYPVKSTRKMIAAAAFVMSSGASVLVVMALILLNFTILSRAECELRTGMPVLAEVPVLPRGQSPFTAEGVSVHHEEYRRLHLLLRKRFPEPGAILVVSAPENGCGVSSVVAGLAAAAGRADERVLVIDAHLRAERGDADAGASCKDVHQSVLGGKPGTGGASRPGLGEYLSFHADQPEEVAMHTEFSGVTFIPCGKSVVMVDMIGSKRMAELLGALSRKYSLILLDTAPVAQSSDAVILANQADAVLLVARAGQTTFFTLRNAAARLAAAEKPLAGVVLNGVLKDYLERV